MPGIWVRQSVGIGIGTVAAGRCTTRNVVVGVDMIESRGKIV